MVPPRQSAAAEERQRKLQEYLAAKGKLKCQNTKPYLKAKNNCLNPLPSKSNIIPKKDVINRVALPIKATRPISIKLQPRPANITESQKAKLEAPKLQGKRLTSECVSSNSNCKPSSNSQQQHKAGSSTIGELSRKTVGSFNIQELKTVKQQVADQRNTKCLDSVDNNHVENEPLDSCLKEMNKENLPQTFSDSERKPNPELWTIGKPKTNTYNQVKSSLPPKQALGKSSGNSAILKGRVNKQFVGKTQIRIPPIKSQQLSRGTNLARPGEKLPRIVPSHNVQTLSRNQASKKPVVKDRKDIKVNRDKYERPNETKLQSHTVTEQKVKQTKPWTCPNVIQGGFNNRHPNIKQDQKSTQPCFRTRTSCALQKSKAISQRPNLAVGSSNSVIPSTPNITANGTNGSKCSNSYQQKAQILDSKLKKTLPQNHFLNKTAPKTQAGNKTVSGRRVPNGTQTNPNIKKKITAEDRRKQLEEWQKSKGKIYKRPPMELKTKRKIIEEMNISFWKSMEEEDEEKKAQLELSNKINNTLTQCLQLIEEGVPSNAIFTILSSIPEVEKFAKFWICKAKLLASKGTFDVIGLYEEAIRNGATPIQELREVVLNILQDPNRTTEGVTSDSSVAETNIRATEELTNKTESEKSCLSLKEGEQVITTPQITKAEQDNHPGIKLQIAPIPRISGMPEVQDMKLITPVRRSARIERAVSRYPEMLQGHDLVVASLNELLEVEETECFIFRKNEALPVTLGFKILES
ncbi:cytoskeleton-associated protein 2-like isoform X1 [Zalophus californianus]|uniref:Cytoskeleton-associated protein 2-like isoform X1 n=1 Tax=Zalophus californianus TaxID=9704 RepID=A0A6J2FEC5_ZALCA|nr:cytoskeleton-associated protein 2-like isoform X1 [Zalophus californianus]XP_027978294.1 cytoskeleton-associated protein 2-like [Eumetopias jubatus]